MIRIVVILVVLAILLGGGAFGLSIVAPAVLPEPVRKIFGVHLTEEDLKRAETPKPTTNIDLEPLTIPLFKDGDVDRFLVMHILLVVEAGDKATFVNQRMPRIVDALITYTHALASLDVPPGIADRAFLKSRLKARLDEVLGPGYIQDILFADLFERPLHG